MWLPKFLTFEATSLLTNTESCISHLYEEGWIEIFQALHAEQLAGWNNLVEDRIKGKKFHQIFSRIRVILTQELFRECFLVIWGLGFN